MSGKETEAKVFAHAKFNVSALLDLGKRIRQKACNCDLSQTPATGSLNWVITISFDDGIDWIFRSPRTYYGIDTEIAGSLIASEAATMKYIRRNSSIPVPEIFAFHCTKANEIGVPFILMSKAQGSALNARSWDTRRCSKVPTLHGKSHLCLTSIQRKKIMKQIGGIISQLSRLRFDYIGSLFEEAGTYQIKSALSPAFCLHGRDEFIEINRGPFTHEREYYKSLVSAFLLHVEYLPLEHHIFLAPVPIPDEYNRYDDYLSATDRWNDFVTIGSKIDSGKNRLNYVILGRLLQDIIPSLVEESNLSPTGLGAKYPLCHPDLSVNNIFIDNDYNITCIIDWAFSTSVPFSALLATPGLPHPRDEMTPPLVRAFRNGFEEDQQFFSEGLKTKMGRRHAVWDNCRKIWLFTRLVNLDSLQDICHFAELYTSVSGKENVKIPTLLQAVQMQEEFLCKALSLAADNQPSSDIERQEREYFSQVGLKRLALSRKLTLVSDMSGSFMADHRLWKWIAKAVDLEEN